MCAPYNVRRSLARTSVFFFSSHGKTDGTVIRHGGQGKRIARLGDVPRRSRSHVKRFRENGGGRAGGIACRKERELGCIAMHEIPSHGEKRGYASLRIEMVSPLSALSRDGSFPSLVDISEIFFALVARRKNCAGHQRRDNSNEIIHVHLIKPRYAHDVQLIFCNKAVGT